LKTLYVGRSPTEQMNQGIFCSLHYLGRIFIITGFDSWQSEHQLIPVLGSSVPV